VRKFPKIAFSPRHYLIDPALWRESGPPELVFTNVRFGNKTVPIASERNSPLKAHINTHRQITLPPSQKAVTIEFAALDFESINLQHYAARLEPFERQFSDLGNVSHVTYTNLPPGDYSLYARAANSRGIWTKDAEILKITVQRAWWQEWPFRAGLFALITGSIVLVFHLRTKSVRKHNLLLEEEIIQRKTIQEILSSREQFIRNVTDHIPILIAYVDHQKRILFANNRFRELFNRSDQEITRCTLQDIYETLYEVTIAPRAEAALRGQEGTYRSELGLDQGQIQLYDTHYVPHRDASGNVIGFLLLAENVTEQVYTEQELHRRRDELAHFSRVALVGEMTGALAHEINQPLAGVSFQAQAARRLLAKPGELDSIALSGIIEDILSDNDRAGQIVKRLWLLYKRSDAVSGEVDVIKLVQDTVELSRSHRELNDLVLAAELPDVRLYVSGDYIQLQQVLLNLLRNAEDSILEKQQQSDDSGPSQPDLFRISVTYTAEDIEIIVKDRGLGISPERLATLFTPFESSKSTGLGLGLAISKNIIESHHGTIRVESAQGIGATFSVLMPRLATLHK
ncbi:MAG: ATP-binding protein, partial [Verrucomicrobia bacterium]|nr:ATP-binding protein [Verrucomicrobiota bacterium]